MKAMSASLAVQLLDRVGTGQDLSSCELEVFVDRGVSADRLREHLKGGAGVVTYTDRVVEITATDEPKTDRLLSAELVFPGEDRSRQVRWDGSAYLVTTCVERPGDVHLREVVEHLSVERGKRVRYAVYLKTMNEGEAPEVGVWRPFASRLLGIEKGQEG